MLQKRQAEKIGTQCHFRHLGVILTLTLSQLKFEYEDNVHDNQNKPELFSFDKAMDNCPNRIANAPETNQMSQLSNS